MKIEIKRPNEDYPLVFVHIPKATNEVDLDILLAHNRVTILGMWEADGDGYKAPGLLEDEHIKPKKKPGRVRYKR